MAYPRRRNPVLRALGATVLRLTGWRFENAFPEVPKCIAIVAPHTSNWDFPLGVAACFALDLRSHYLAKHTIFVGPLGWLLRWLGGIPVDRSAAGGRVESVAARIRSAEALCLGITPEGTRRRVPEWKTGFQRIARAAGVPIVPVWFDYGRRTIGFGAPFWPTDDVAADLRTLWAMYRPEMARHPEQFALPPG